MSGITILPLAIRRHAAVRPLGLAVCDEASDLTFGQLDLAADTVADTLGELGVARGDRVALLAAPSRESIVFLVGIARAGAVAVPLGTRLTRREVAAALAEVAPTVLIHDADLAGVAGGHGVRAIDLAGLVAEAAAVTPTDVPAVPPREADELDADATAVAVFTSGTSGRPRAALLSHRALGASATAWTAALPPASGWLLCLGLAHVAGLGVAWRALGAGLPLHVVARFEPDAVLALMRGPDAPSHVSVVPVQLTRLLEAGGAVPGDAPADAAHAPAALRAVLLGGAPIPPALVRRAAAAGWPVIPTYGLTEAGSGVTALPAGEATTTPESAGRPLPGVMLRIAGPGPDGVGEIEVRTPAAFSGYLGREGATRAAFTADGWLRTGDLGRLDAADRLFVADRRDDLVVSGGENVYPAEVEAVLASHPAVEEAGVAGRADPTWGAVPVAGIVVRPGVPDPGDAALRAWCRERLARAKVPASFVRLAALPRTPSGKLRRRGAPRDAHPARRPPPRHALHGPPAAPRWPALSRRPATFASLRRIGRGAGRGAWTRRARSMSRSTSRTSRLCWTRRASSAPSSWATASAASWPSKLPRASRNGLRPSSSTSCLMPRSPTRPSGPTSPWLPARLGTPWNATAGYVLGHNRWPWVNALGGLSLLAVVFGRSRSRRPESPHGPEEAESRQRAYIRQAAGGVVAIMSTVRYQLYSHYERMWHWCQAVAIGLLMADRPGDSRPELLRLASLCHRGPGPQHPRLSADRQRLPGHVLLRHHGRDPAVPARASRLRLAGGSPGVVLSPRHVSRRAPSAGESRPSEGSTRFNR